MNIRRTVSFCVRVVVIAILIVPVMFFAFLSSVPGLNDFADRFLEKLGKKATNFHTAMNKWEDFTPENTMELLKKDFKK